MKNPMLEGADITDGWDPTPREFPAILEPKPYHAPGTTPLVEGHIQLRASEFERAAEAVSVLTTTVVDTAPTDTPVID